MILALLLSFGLFICGIGFAREFYKAKVKGLEKRVAELDVLLHGQKPRRENGEAAPYFIRSRQLNLRRNGR